MILDLQNITNNQIKIDMFLFVFVFLALQPNVFFFHYKNVFNLDKLCFFVFVTITK